MRAKFDKVSYNEKRYKFGFHRIWCEYDGVFEAGNIEKYVLRGVWGRFNGIICSGKRYWFSLRGIRGEYNEVIFGLKGKKWRLRQINVYWVCGIIVMVCTLSTLTKKGLDTVL